MSENHEIGGEMETLEAITTRRSVSRLTEPAPSREDIGQMLSAAVRAPNHHLTEPWRFIVLSGPALAELGEAFVERVRQESPGVPDLEKRIENARTQPHRAPVIIVLVYRRSANERAIENEDRYAVGAAGQNILLAAHSMGWGAYWRTGPNAEHPAVRQHLGIGDDEEIAGFIYLGTPEEQGPREPSRRAPVEESTEWRGWE